MNFKVMFIFNKDVVLQSGYSLHLEVKVVYKLFWEFIIDYEIYCSICTLHYVVK
jgi:hypothetical protein